MAIPFVPSEESLFFVLCLCLWDYLTRLFQFYILYGAERQGDDDDYYDNVTTMNELERACKEVDVACIKLFCICLKILRKYRKGQDVTVFCPRFELESTRIRTWLLPLHLNVRFIRISGNPMAVMNCNK